MKEIKITHGDGTHITTITEDELQQILTNAENCTQNNNKDLINTIKFIRLSVNVSK